MKQFSIQRMYLKDCKKYYQERIRSVIYRTRLVLPFVAISRIMQLIISKSTVIQLNLSDKPDELLTKFG